MLGRWLRTTLAILALGACDDDGSGATDAGGGERDTGGAAGDAGLGGAGGDLGAAAACERLVPVSCARLVECGALTEADTPFTDVLCAAAQPQLVQDCAERITATDADTIDACAAALASADCALVCAGIDPDPCAGLVPGEAEALTCASP